MKAGAPKTGEVRGQLKSVTFKADHATIDAIAQLEARTFHGEGAAKGGMRSEAIRRGLLLAARVDNGKTR